MEQSNIRPKRNRGLIIGLFIVIIALVAVASITYRGRDKKVTQEAASDSSTVESSINNNWSGVGNPNPASEPKERKDSLGKDTI
jgi:hypothetical protein